MMRSFLSKSPSDTAGNPTFFNKGQFAHGYNGIIQTQTVTPGAVSFLSKAQVGKAILYNNMMYPPAQLRLLQKALQITETGISDSDTAQAVAQYQDMNGLQVDGMAGPITFNTIQGDAGIADKDDLIIFNVVDVGNGVTRTTGPGGSDMLGHFKVEIYLPPGSCEDYEYRQFICGEAEVLPAGAGPTTPFQSINTLFTTQPGGTLPHIPNFHEDGNTTLGARFGHRNRSSLPENKYVDATGNIDQATGCHFLSEDFPGITGRTTVRGEIYDFDFRFFGIVKHKTRGRVAERFWNIKGTIPI